ncbi:MAG: HAMP domain-containing protein [Acetobacteraceae bacterium]|nr:HAMP domain-containing protein [Acetobacteraceae bacterium]
MRLPRSLAGQTALVLIPTLVTIQLAALLILAADRIELQRLADSRDFGRHVVSLYRTMMLQPEAWTSAVRDLEPPMEASLESGPPGEALEAAPPDVQQLIRPYLGLGPMPQAERPRSIQVRGRFEPGSVLLVAVQAPDGRWLYARTQAPARYPWHSARFLIAFALTSGTTIVAGLWAVRRLSAPLHALAIAAERLGRDVNAPPLPERGPTEVKAAAVTFNTMAARIRRFVADRTFLLTAIGHDLRTPITRLKLRAEWMEDDEQRRKMLADLDELEAMVSATLAFGRDVAGSEPPVALDLAALVRTVLDEVADARPLAADAISYDGPEHLTVPGRPVALKRALANLVGNALAYGGKARVVLEPPQDGVVAVRVEDAGPGIPADQLERVFEPFQRLETSRNRETGGIGLGLPIVRNIVRAHGGDITLANRAEGGVRATVTLPA